jgi:hypothetical protein
MLPTRNCREAMPAHLEVIGKWLTQVEEVVVVDSHSTDGTLEYLKENLKHPRVQFLSHPPGLYESWNHGLSQITASYTYIATVGDAIPTETLVRLVEVAENQKADAVISPPDFVDEQGQPTDKLWPIRVFLEQHPGWKTGSLSHWEWFAWAVMYLPGSLLGSSASNIYRTDYMQRHLFPIGYGHACDTAWALANAFDARFVLAPELRSVFWVHPAERTGSKERYLKCVATLVELAGQVLRTQCETAAKNQDLDEVKNLLTHCLNEMRDKMASKLAYREGRLWWCPWFLQPAALRHRRRYVQADTRIAALRGEIVDALKRIKFEI